MEAVGLLRVPSACPASVLHQLLARQALAEFNISKIEKKNKIFHRPVPSRIQGRLRAFRLDFLWLQPGFDVLTQFSEQIMLLPAFDLPALCASPQTIKSLGISPRSPEGSEADRADSVPCPME